MTCVNVCTYVYRVITFNLTHRASKAKKKKIGSLMYLRRGSTGVGLNSVGPMTYGFDSPSCQKRFNHSYGTQRSV